MSHCPSHDWDAEYDRQERQMNSAFLDELQTLAAACLPVVIGQNPKLASADVAQLAFEHAAELYIARMDIENSLLRPLPRSGADIAMSWGASFVKRYGDIAP